MENQEISSRLAAIEGDIKAIPGIKTDIVAIRGEIKIVEKDVSHIKEDISALKEGQVRLEIAVSELRKGQSEVSGMLKLLVALPETVAKQGRRISWLYGLVAAAAVFAGTYKFSPW